jgi:NADPH2:quinone reductase
MRAIVVTDSTDGGTVRMQVEPEPEPAAREVLVRVEAAGVNFRDIYEIDDERYGREPPFIPGIEGAGKVERLGCRVTELRLGDRVAWYDCPGSCAEQIAVSTAKVVRIPDELAIEAAAAGVLQGLTAHYLACSVYPIKPGDTILIHSVCGGTGLFLAQVAKLLGARVLGTASDAAKYALAVEHGVDAVFGYGDFVREVMTRTDGEGVAVVYDGVGRDTFEGSLASLRRRGVLAMIGESSGPVPPIDATLLVRDRGVFLTRPSIRPYAATWEEFFERTRDVFEWLIDGHVKLHVGCRLPLSQTATAYELLRSRSSSGKILILPQL